MIKGTKKHKWSEEDRKDILNMLYSGKSLTEIGEKYNRHYSTMTHQLKKWGISAYTLRRELLGKVPKVRSKKQPPHKYDGIIYNLNRGRSYASYLYREDQKKADLSKWLKKSKLQEA